MRLGLSGGGATLERMIEQAQTAEADGFTSVWYAGGVGGDPLVPMSHVGRATTSIELGTSILPTYPCHPVLMAGRATSAANAIGRPGLTLGIGPSHAPVVEGMYGLSYDRPGRHTEEYVQVVTALLGGDAVDFDGADFRVHQRGTAPEPGPVPVLVAALAPRLLRVAGSLAHGTITWMANARAVAELIAPRVNSAAAAAGSAAPRVVVGLPVAVHDDVDAAREVAARQFGFYGQLPNYQRVLAAGGVTDAADAAIVGDEATVAAQLQLLVAAGATDVWAAPFPVGDDRATSRDRTYALLRDLAVS
jgi:F420-dependent oxidoreductase-like protein